MKLLSDFLTPHDWDLNVSTNCNKFYMIVEPGILPALRYSEK